MPRSLLLWSLVTFLIVWDKPVSAEGGFVLATSDSEDCRTELDYAKPDLAESASFVIRSGYSRGNDDMAEGNYETAVLDLELVGRKHPSGGACLFLVATNSLVAEQEKADEWAKLFYLRAFDVKALDPNQGRMVRLGGIQARGEPFKVLDHKRPPYTIYSKISAIRKGESKVSLRSILFLGQFDTAGFYQGRAFMQMNDDGFKNIDDQNYQSVRHVVQWSVSLNKEGNLEGLKATAEFAQGKGNKSLAGFLNEVRLITPSWNGKFIEGESGKPGENKLHRVKLLWRDVVTIGKDRTYARADLLELYEKSQTAENLTKYEYEPIGRLDAKPEKD